MEPDGGEWVLMLWAAWGKDKTVNYLKALSKNNIVFGAGSTARTEMLAAGAFKIDLRLNLHRVPEFQKEGAPIEWVRTDPIYRGPRQDSLQSALRIPMPPYFLLIFLRRPRDNRRTTMLREDSCRIRESRAN